MDELRLPGVVAAGKTPLDAPDFISEQLRALVPEFFGAAELLAGVIGVAMAGAHQALGNRNDIVGEATRMILTHIANDGVDLLYDLLHGRGRPALKTARSMYEHQIAVELVIDPAMAQRYLDHDAVGRRSFLDLGRVERFLRGNALRAYRFKLKKLERDTRSSVNDAVAAYGADFRRKWTPSDLRTHATNLGRGADYAFYKTASLPTHGAAAGIFGARRTVSGAEVYRTGPSLAACPLAAIYGLGFMDTALVVADQTVGAGALEPWRIQARSLLDATPAYMTAVEELDGKLWPETAPINPAPLIVVDSHEQAELWMAMPDRGVAFPYDGDYLVTDEQQQTYEKLIYETLPTLKVERLGLILLNSGGLDFRRVNFRAQRPLSEVVVMGIFGIKPDGVVLVERGIKAEPYLDDLLGPVASPPRL